MVQKKAVESLRKQRIPKQPDICKIYGGICGYPIECCSECPNHDFNDTLRQIYGILYDYFQDKSTLNDMMKFRKWLERTNCEDAISRAELLEHVWRDKLDSRELIAELVERMPSVEPVACIAKVSFDEEKMKEMVDEAAKDIVEQCDDCISRESAKNAIREKFKDLPIRCEINEVLNSIPSVQPARPKGKWRFVGDGVVECNKCETVYNYDLFPRNFCPNCGADMIEPMLKEAGQYADNDTLMPAT